MPDYGHVKEGAGRKPEFMAPTQSPGPLGRVHYPLTDTKGHNRNSTLPSSPQVLLPPLPSASCTSHSCLPSMDSSRTLPVFSLT